VVTPGTRLGPYEIVALLGAGGMGEVYRARDTKLDREVAIKVLPELFVSDPERVARFQREAKTLASLNHPHIGGIYGLEDTAGVHALVLELVDGPTLADRIAQGPIPLDETLAIAKQIAAALEAAHEQGIIHRDLKPANIKLRPDGAVKVLDFGLAKAMEPMSSASASATASPTITTPAMMTGIGTILGTAAYMSPEQAKGRPADKRSDVWAFGCVVYEMLTGRRPFEGDDVHDTLAAVLRGQPEWSILPDDIGETTRVMLQRCLEKDRSKRLSDIGIARFLITEPALASKPASAPALMHSPPAYRWWRRVTPLAASAVVGGAVIGGAVWQLRPAAPQPSVTRFTFGLPEGQRITNTGRHAIALSPDGSRIVYEANRRLYVRSLADVEATALPSAQGGPVTSPVFSPDGRWIAFWSAPGVLYKVAISGGAPIRLCELENPYGITWSGDSLLVGGGERGILRVSSNGGPPEVIIRVKDDELAQGPQRLPDGRSILFTLAKGTDPDRWDGAQIVVQPAGSADRKTIVTGGADGRYVRSGHIVYALAGVLFAQKFDAGRLEVQGEPVPVVEGVRSLNQAGAAQFAVSGTGSLLYLPGTTGPQQAVSELALLDRSGAVERLKLPQRRYGSPRFSPNGRQLAVGINDGRDANIWVYDLSGNSQIRQLTEGGRNRFPIWTPDGVRIAFQSDREGTPSIFWQQADGSGAAERLTKAEPGQAHIPNAWSPNAEVLLFSVRAGTANFSLWSFTLHDKKAAAFAAVQSLTEPSAMFSPDGRSVAYNEWNRENGTVGTVYVRPFPATSVKFRVGGGVNPFWGSDGKRLYFVAAPGASAFSVVNVTTEPSFSVSAPGSVPRPQLAGGGPNIPRAYDIAPDGQHFVIMVPAETSTTPENVAPQLHMVLNWTEELKQRVPSR
jgi:eukaryotic-like serine/threonine-protein kinase